MKFSKRNQTGLLTEPVNTYTFTGGEKNPVAQICTTPEKAFLFPSKQNLHLLQAIKVLGEIFFCMCLHGALLSRGVDDATQEKEQPPPSHCKSITAQLGGLLSSMRVSSPPREARTLLTLQSSFRGEERGAQQGETGSVLTLSS